jgi:hypothetical protein
MRSDGRAMKITYAILLMVVTFACEKALTQGLLE